MSTTLSACADSLLECRREVLALKADLARCYDVCGEAIGSEYRNVGVVEACASFVGTLQADLAAEREARERAEAALREIRDRHASIEPTTCFECEATLVRSTLALEDR